MDAPLNITFHDIDKSEAVEEKIRERADRLERRYGRIISCRVTIAAPHASHRKGKLFSCSVEVSIPGADIVANRNPGEDHAHEDVLVAVRDAFDAAERRLEDAVRKRRGQIKRREAPPEGRIARLFPDYGFILDAAGQETYFHKNSVTGDFEKLNVGDPVRFVAQDGESAAGPQASTVTPLVHLHPRPDTRD
ncbi:MAG: HPF/RaiA family ribosome-associated protein [Gemmatimonas sp.]